MADGSAHFIDEIVEQRILEALATNWQAGVSAAAAVPEPHTLVLLAAMALPMLLLRRR